VLDRGHLVAEGTPDELKRRIPGGHIQLRFRDLPGLEGAASVLGEASRDEGALVLRVPADGTPQSVKAVLDRLGQQALGADSITVHTPDLDDVFFALTSHPRRDQEIPA
jgi:ABC-2 type transport system ATP-binding protein